MRLILLLVGRNTNPYQTDDNNNLGDKGRER